MKVIHNTEKTRFEIVFEDATAVLDYDLSETQITVTHTFVPAELRGKNLAAQLTEAALSFAKDAALEVVPQCSYTAAYLRRKKR